MPSGLLPPTLTTNRDGALTFAAVSDTLGDPELQRLDEQHAFYLRAANHGVSQVIAINDVASPLAHPLVPGMVTYCQCNGSVDTITRAGYAGVVWVPPVISIEHSRTGRALPLVLIFGYGEVVRPLVRLKRLGLDPTHPAIVLVGGARKAPSVDPLPGGGFAASTGVFSAPRTEHTAPHFGGVIIELCLDDDLTDIRYVVKFCDYGSVPDGRGAAPPARALGRDTNGGARAHRGL